jgi:hypothetical protein
VTETPAKMARIVFSTMRPIQIFAKASPVNSAQVTILSGLPVELSEAELESVSAGLDPTTGGSMLVAMALIPGINVGIAAFALTTGLGFILGNAFYGGGGSWFKSSRVDIKMH